MIDAADLVSLITKTSGPGPGSLNGVFDLDTIKEWLEEASTAPFDSLRYESRAGEVSYRWAIRALAATLPGKSLDEAAVRIHRMLGNRDITVLEVKTILRGQKDETPFSTLQEIGKLLAQGQNYAEIGRALGINRKTAIKVDHFLGMTTARKDKLLGIVLSYLDEGGISRRVLANRHGLTTHEAQTLITEAKKIHEELRNA